jgi:hypothetical protein
MSGYAGFFTTPHPIRLRILFDAAVQVLRMKADIGPIKEGRIEDCIRIVQVLANDGHIIKGEPLNMLQIVLPTVVSIVLAVVGIWHVSRRLHAVAVK